jgi:beta-glucosidase
LGQFRRHARQRGARRDGGLACDHYHRWEEDLDLIAALGADVYRFSTSWARVMPEGHGRAQPEGLDFYDRLVDGMLARGLKPAATLYHWELPQALADRGGWRNADMPNWFADFTHTVMSRIGDRVWSAAPINEPWCVAWLSHFEGHHAPGLRDIRAAARAMHHVLKAHGASIEVMRGLGMKQPGRGGQHRMARARHRRARDIEAAAARMTRSTIASSWAGCSTAPIPRRRWRGSRRICPTAGRTISADPRPARLDRRELLHPQAPRAVEGAWPGMAEAETVLPTTQMGWEIYPDGLRDFLCGWRASIPATCRSTSPRTAWPTPTPRPPDSESASPISTAISPPCGRPSPKARRLRAISSGR